jgi:hypothetical protein
MCGTDQGILEAMAIEDLAAGASHQGVGLLRRQFLASLPHRIFSSGPILFVTSRLKISLGSFPPKKTSRRLRNRRGPRRRLRRFHLVFARVRSWIETAIPLPWIFIIRIAAADRDRADAHVTIVDVPAFLAGVSRSAAGEFGHAPLKRESAG